MNEKVLQDLYNRAVSKGYSKTIEDFSVLLEENETVFNDNFNYVTSKGYTKGKDEFSTLVGLKKKRRFRGIYFRLGAWRIGFWRD